MLKVLEVLRNGVMMLKAEKPLGKGWELKYYKSNKSLIFV